MKCTDRALLVTLCLTLLLAFGCDEEDDSSSPTSPANATELEGTWTGYEQGSSLQWTWNFTGATLNVTTGSTEVYGGTFTVNTTTSPKRLTVTITSSSIPQYEGQTARAAYELSGNSLTVASYEPGNTSYPPSLTASLARVWDLTKQ
ncbi:MAG: hypothetical protein GF331_00115 [Chitinivibrionales bacterium]|nr:hypothetical protein [Chitinivibrionales bacterium]